MQSHWDELMLATKVSQPCHKPVRPDTSPFDHRSFLFYQIHTAVVAWRLYQANLFFTNQNKSIL
jgi:hypothetical protein